VVSSLSSNLLQCCVSDRIQLVLSIYKYNNQRVVVRADQQLKTVTLGASKGRAIGMDVITDALHIQVK
jgi:hypothetical protein